MDKDLVKGAILWVIIILVASYAYRNFFSEKAKMANGIYEACMSTGARNDNYSKEQFKPACECLRDTFKNKEISNNALVALKEYGISALEMLDKEDFRKCIPSK